MQLISALLCSLHEHAAPFQSTTGDQPASETHVPATFLCKCTNPKPIQPAPLVPQPDQLTHLTTNVGPVPLSCSKWLSKKGDNCSSQAVMEESTSGAGGSQAEAASSIFHGDSSLTSCCSAKKSHLLVTSQSI